MFDAVIEAIKQMGSTAEATEESEEPQRTITLYYDDLEAAIAAIRAAEVLCIGYALDGRDDNNTWTLTLYPVLDPAEEG